MDLGRICSVGSSLKTAKHCWMSKEIHQRHQDLGRRRRRLMKDSHFSRSWNFQTSGRWFYLASSARLPSGACAVCAAASWHGAGKLFVVVHRSVSLSSSSLCPKIQHGSSSGLNCNGQVCAGIRGLFECVKRARPHNRGIMLVFVCLPAEHTCLWEEVRC